MNARSSTWLKMATVLTFSASKHLYATRHTTLLANLLFFHQTAVKTAGYLLLWALRVDKVEYAPLWTYFSRRGASHLLPFYWWISVPLICALAFSSMLGLLVRYPVDGFDVDLNRLSSMWALRLQHEYGVHVPRRRRGSFGCEKYYAEDDESDSSSLYDRAEEANPDDRVHLNMSTVLRLRREGVDLEKWRYGVRQATMADSRPSWM